MKKKFLLLFVFVLLFTVGCGTKEPDSSTKTRKEEVPVKVDGEEFKLYSRDNLKNLYYLRNYTDFDTDAVGKTRIMRYRKDGETIFEVRIMYEDEHSFEENTNQIKYKATDRKINNINYKYYVYRSTDDYVVHTYMTSYNDVTYVVMFISVKELPDLENIFMKNVYFK